MSFDMLNHTGFHQILIAFVYSWYEMKVLYIYYSIHIFFAHKMRSIIQIFSFFYSSIDLTIIWSYVTTIKKTSFAVKFVRKVFVIVHHY